MDIDKCLKVFINMEWEVFFESGFNYVCNIMIENLEGFKFVFLNIVDEIVLGCWNVIVELIDVCLFFVDIVDNFFGEEE